MDFILQIGKFALIGGLTAAVLRFAFSRNATNHVTQTATDIRRIKPSHPVYLTLTIIFGAASIGLAIIAAKYMGTYTRGNSIALMLLLTFTTGSTWCISSYLHSGYNIDWDETGLTGPSSYLPLPFGPQRIRIEFTDITDVGTDWADSFCIYRADGASIRFSYLYRGFLALNDLIENKRPDLFPE